MYKATRELIKARQPYTDYIVEVVAVKKIGGGVANECHENSANEVEKGVDAKAVSGWLVNPFDKNTNSTAIIQHWWNIDVHGVFYDTTPGIDDELQYVIDIEIAAYGNQATEELDDYVAASLLLQDGKFYAVKKIYGELKTRELPSLETKNLFHAFPA